MRYQVKYLHKGEVRYGIVSGQKAKRAGDVIVEDAVLPLAVSVLNASLEDVPLNTSARYDRSTGAIIEGGSYYDKFVNDAYLAAVAASESAGPGVVKDKMFSIGVADGCAHYVVVDVYKDRATVEWRGFSADRYTDHFFSWGRTVSVADVKVYTDRVDAELAARKRKETELSSLSSMFQVGQHVHVYHSGSDFVRYEVIDRGGVKAYKAIGLVGEWRHSRPTRDLWGDVSVLGEAKWVLAGEVVESLQPSTVWENTSGFGWPSRKRGKTPIEDPTGKPCLDLSVPEMTEEERKAAGLWRQVQAVREALARDNSANPKDPAVPAAILSSVRKLLRKKAASKRTTSKKS